VSGVTPGRKIRRAGVLLDLTRNLSGGAGLSLAGVRETDARNRSTQIRGGRHLRAPGRRSSLMRGAVLVRSVNIYGRVEPGLQESAVSRKSKITCTKTTRSRQRLRERGLCGPFEG